MKTKQKYGLPFKERGKEKEFNLPLLQKNQVLSRSCRGLPNGAIMFQGKLVTRLTVPLTVTPVCAAAAGNVHGCSRDLESDRKLCMKFSCAFSWRWRTPWWTKQRTRNFWPVCFCCLPVRDRTLFLGLNALYIFMSPIAAQLGRSQAHIRLTRRDWTYVNLDWQDSERV